MQTAEEIFNKHSWAALGAISPSKDFCIEAMLEFARQACEEQKKICSINLENAFGISLPERAVVLQSELPSLK